MAETVLRKGIPLTTQTKEKLQAAYKIIEQANANLERNRELENEIVSLNDEYNALVKNNKANSDQGKKILTRIDEKEEKWRSSEIKEGEKIDSVNEDINNQVETIGQAAANMIVFSLSPFNPYQLIDPNLLGRRRAQASLLTPILTEKIYNDVIEYFHNVPDILAAPDIIKMNAKFLRQGTIENHKRKILPQDTAPNKKQRRN